MTDNDKDIQTGELVEIWYEWLRNRQIDDLVEREELFAVTEEISSNEKTIEGLRNLYVVLWGFATAEISDETRSVREVIGPELADTIVEYARNNEPDETTVRIMFRNEATESMFGRILYEGITEFLSRVDIVSKLLDQLPLIGGIKGKIESNFPEGIKSLLEGRIKEFLGNFSGAAAEQAMNYVLSPEHVDDFCEIQAELVDHLLNKPVRDLLPPDESLQEFRESLWSSFTTQINRVEETNDRIDRFLKMQGDRSMEQFLPQEQPEHLDELFAGIIEEFLDQSEVQEWFRRYLDE